MVAAYNCSVHASSVHVMHAELFSHIMYQVAEIPEFTVMHPLDSLKCCTDASHI